MNRYRCGFFLDSAIVMAVLAIAGLHAPLKAQSIYSAGGFGDYRYSISTRSAAMGGVGVAVNEDIVYNIQNPAVGAFLQNTTIASGFRFEGMKISQQNTGFKNSLSRWSGFSFSVKIVDRFGIAGGIIPFSDFNFDMQLEDPENNYLRIAEGRGGITRGFGAAAFKITPSLSLGLMVSRYFGQLEEEFSVNFSETNTIDTFNKIETNIVGNNYRLGVYYARSRYSLGGYYSLTSNITGNSSLSISPVLPPLTSKFPVRIPVQWGVGSSARLSRGFLVGLDIQGINFKNLKIGESLQQFQNGFQIALGAEYSPARGLNPPAIRKLDYRAGLSTRELYILDIDGSSIREYTVGFGFGLPFNRQMSRIDIAFELGTRGSKSADLVQERFIRAGISLGFREEWFQEGADRRRPEGRRGTGSEGQNP